MRFDIFCSIAQTPRAGGRLPTHATVLREFLDQACLADKLGFGCLWVAESHYSSELQKTHAHPAIPHWAGEIGLNTDVCQLAAYAFERTQRIEVGSAITSVLANGGPLAAAERVAMALAWHGLNPGEERKLRIGFAAGRFDFITRSTGVVPRNDWEEVAWKQVRHAAFWEAGEIFVRLLGGEDIAAEDIAQHVLTPADFTDRGEFEQVVRMAGASGDKIRVSRRWDFEATRIVPANGRDLLRLYAGTHDPALVEHFNRFSPVRVLNLSITPPGVIDSTHRRMSTAYHGAGGTWRRDYMPRTVFVFVDSTPGQSTVQRRARAHGRAREALAAYWKALEGTLDLAKVEAAVDNALIGAPEDVAREIAERFHPRDRLMLWFDFFTNSGDQALAAMETFWHEVVPSLGRYRITTEG